MIGATYYPPAQIPVRVPDWLDHLHPHDRWEIAYHESGHIIAHLAVGLGTPLEAFIEPAGSSLAHVRTNVTPHFRGAQYAVYAIAGAVCEALVMCAGGPSPRGRRPRQFPMDSEVEGAVESVVCRWDMGGLSGTDAEGIEQWVQGDEGRCEQVAEEAARMLVGNWAAVRVTARLLWAQGWLSRDDIFSVTRSPM